MRNNIAHTLLQLGQTGNLRSLETIEGAKKHITLPGYEVPMLNLSSNDYLGLSHNKELLEEFWSDPSNRRLPMTSSSSRLLSGTSPQHQALEQEIGISYSKTALLLGSGYHANAGILPALGTPKDLILADRLSHASLIDGILMSQAKHLRFKHNNFNHLQTLLEKYAGEYHTIFIVVESIYSMDGDVADLKKLVELKKEYSAKSEIVLYVDEAHAMGVRGKTGLGLCQETGVTGDVDIIMGTLGKGMASAGAFVAADKTVTDYLVNKMRTFVFTTALPPVAVAWSHFIWNKQKNMDSLRQNLSRISALLRCVVEKKQGGNMLSQSQIVPYIVGGSSEAVLLAEHLKRQGFYVLPIRPPTVPQGSARLRFSLTADITEEEIYRLASFLG